MMLLTATLTIAGAIFAFLYVGHWSEVELVTIVVIIQYGTVHIFHSMVLRIIRADILRVA